MSRKVLWFSVFVALQAASTTAHSQAPSPLTGFADFTFPGQHWAYFGSNRHAYNIYWVPGRYGFDDATDASHAPDAALGSALTGFADVDEAGQHWAYFDSNGHAYNIYWVPGRYGVDNVTNRSGAPAAAPGSPLTSFGEPSFSGPLQHWAYFDSNGDVYSISWNPDDGYWADDATALSFAPAAAPGSPLISFRGDFSNWAYFDSNGHAYNIFLGLGYSAEDVTARSGAPAAAPGSPLAGFAGSGFFPTENWAYFDSYGHLYIISWTHLGGYRATDLTAFYGAPPPAPGSPLIGFADFTYDAGNLAYFDSNGHAYNIFLTYGLVDDVTALSFAPAAAPGSPLTAFADVTFPSAWHWAYLDGNGHAYNIFRTPDGGYGVHDVTIASGAPPAR